MRPDLIESEIASLTSDLSPPYACVAPLVLTSPLIFCSPHSGRTYTKPFRASAILDAIALRKSEDAYVDMLFGCAPKFGAPLLAALFPRAYLDANREPNELDPHLIDGPLPATANTQSARVIGGLGVVPRVVADGEPIYGAKMPWAVAEARLQYLYQPFHNALAGLLQHTADRFGAAVLVDCHSMPSAAGGNAQSRRPHFILGDRFNTSCDPTITQMVSRFLTREGYDVQLNRPYAGGFITEHYGKPVMSVHALQIEVNRGLYLNEERVEPNGNFESVRALIERLVRHMAEEIPSILQLDPTYRYAAE